MRRKDREIFDKDKIDSILASSECLRLGLYDGEKVYIVPLSFGYEIKEDKYIFYFHSAPEGRKIEILKKNNDVCFELDISGEIIKGETACSYSTNFSSIIGYGKAYFIDEESEKNKAFNILMKHYTKKDDFIFDEQMLKITNLFKVEVSSLSCKCKE